MSITTRLSLFRKLKKCAIYTMMVDLLYPAIEKNLIKIKCAIKTDFG